MSRVREHSSEAGDAELLHRAEAAGVHRIAVPTPLAVGDVNAYVLTGPPLTVVDPGPAAPRCLETLAAGLARLGHALGDVERVFVTHQHVDHAGLAAELARRCGAEVACLDALAPYLAAYRHSRRADEAIHAEILTDLGVPPDVLGPGMARAAASARFGADTEVDAPLPAGAALASGGGALAVLHRPGHSPTDTVLLDPAAGVLLAGDHLLRDTSSTATLAHPMHRPWTGERPRPLLAYRASLRRTREAPADVVLPGHGGPFGDLADAVDRRLRRQERRAEQLHERLRAAGPRTAYEIACSIWGPRADAYPFLSVSDVVGHLDLLVEDGSVRERHDRRGVVFEAA